MLLNFSSHFLHIFSIFLREKRRFFQPQTHSSFFQQCRTSRRRSDIPEIGHDLEAESKVKAVMTTMVVMVATHATTETRKQIMVPARTSHSTYPTCPLRCSINPTFVCFKCFAFLQLNFCHSFQPLLTNLNLTLFRLFS